MNIELDKLNKKYNNVNVLDKFNMSFRESGVVCIFGPSGCGKTTLLNIITGIESYDRGFIKGIKDITFSYIFQEDRLLPWDTAMENIIFVLKNELDCGQKIDIANEYLEKVGLKNFGNTYPHELSGGMKRRVSIARALAYDGDILIMDEPFKGLDLNIKKRLINLILNNWKKQQKLSILVTHDIDEALIMSDEIFVVTGPPMFILDKIGINIPQDERNEYNLSVYRKKLESYIAY
ncbi:ATP-binding cassette domain-containing protein [Clostridiisalibacter paucivorans]|uniref:ATP-binding cassette domain-containing protein n=1 Tax=Clostridiisalibacter paucivorans TaxID=408753 RepID=UPI001FE1F1BA|nr:ABC transporter ATP-binding protein [Clostridiisalibacter paucivorans]